jgi:hypothetical protein
MAPSGFCPDCGFFQAHGASCPTRLSTRELRIERAAHLFAVFSNSEVARQCDQRDGIGDDELGAGKQLAEARRRHRAELVNYLGDPSYGGWTQLLPQSATAQHKTLLPDELPLSETVSRRSEVIPIVATVTAATTNAASNTRAPREVVEFPPNVPVTVALKYPHARTVGSQYGERFMFSLDDGRVMFLAPEVGGKIEALGVNVRENFTITRKWDEHKGALVGWEVARLVGEQPNGTFVVPVVPSKPPASASAATNDARRRQPAVSPTLVEEANSLVDSFAAVLDHALTAYQGRIKPEEAKALLITAYIQRSKSSFAA